MQDFDGDGHDEVYVEMVYRDDRNGPEEDSRGVVIYQKGDDGWVRGPQMRLRNFDARAYPQRPFAVEHEATDIVRINGIAFRFVAYPAYPHAFRPSGTVQPPAMGGLMRPLGAFIDEVPVLYPKGARIPADLGAALKSGMVDTAPLASNPPQPLPAIFGRLNAFPGYPGPARCESAKDCRAIVADLDHDGRDDVVLISNLASGYEATLLKSDGKIWRVISNTELCADIVPDLDKAKIEILPSRWGMIRLGQNLYPVGNNPGCRTGYGLA
jgi:hypothetical protein